MRGHDLNLVRAAESLGHLLRHARSQQVVQLDNQIHFTQHRRCFRIEQRFDFSTPGILASVLGPLAEAGIGIFATSTFSTDYILVKAKDVVGAIKALARAGHRVENAGA